MYLAPIRAFYRAAERVVTLSQQVWNRLVQTVEENRAAIRANRIIAQRPLRLIEGSNGSVLSIDLPKNQQFIVTALPAMATVDGIMEVPPWVICNTFSNNSQGTSNVSVGVVKAHSIGHFIEAAIPSGGAQSNGFQQVDSDGNPIWWQELGPSQGVLHTTALNQSGGTNGSGGSVPSFSALTYDIMDPAGVTVLVAAASAIAPPYLPGPVTAATKGNIQLTNDGRWILIQAFEQVAGFSVCNTSEGSDASLATIAGSALFLNSGNLTNQSGAVSSVATLTPTALGTFRVSANLTVNSVTVDQVQIQATYTDETSTFRTVNLTGIISTTGVVMVPPMDVRAGTGSAITVLTVMNVSSGSISYDVGASILQVS